MPVAFASDAIREFSLTLDEIESNLEFLRLSAILRPRLNGMLLWDSIQGDARRLVTDFLNQKSVELGPQFRGMIIVICGAFEHFVRRVVREAVIKLNAGANSFDNLHGELQRQNVYRTGRALTTIMQPLDHVTVDYSALAGNLATCVSGATTFTLNADAFTLFFTGGKPEHLADILKSIGLTLDWDDFGRISSFEGLLEAKGTRALGRAVSEHLLELMLLRNRLTHSGSGGITVTDADVKREIVFFRIFAPTLTAIVSKKITGR